jgi:hypothetical protein
MNYYEAAKIRKKGFADLMADKLTSGQGVFSSARSALSDRSKARSLGFKEKFDPLNIAKVLTGGSNLAPAMLGRLLGRKTSDIRYFTGKKEYTPRSESSYYNNYTTPSMSGGSQKATRVLQKMLSFMEKSRTDDMQEQDTLDSFKEMNENMREDRHKEVVDVFIQATKAKRKAEKNMAKEAKKREREAKKAEKETSKDTGGKGATDAAKKAKDAADAAKKAKDAADAAAAAKKAKDAADAAKKAKDAADAAKKAKDAADAAKKAKDAADAADAAKKAKDAADAAKKAKDAAEAKRIKDAADAKRAADTAKKQESVPKNKSAEKVKETKSEAPSATPATPAIEAAKTAAKVGVGVAVGTASLLGKEALAKNIAKYESTASAGKSFGGDEYNAYNRGTKDNKILGATTPVDFSKITISEYLKRSKLPIDDPNRLFAVGRYQIIPKTMQGLIQQLKIDPDTTYLTPTVQDYLFSKGLIDINRKKVSDYIEGRTNGIDARNEAILQLSKEFASVGVPFDTYRIDKIKQKDGSIKEVRVELKKGSSYYSGIGGNKAHNPPELVAAALDEDRAKKLKISPAEIPSNVGEEMISKSSQNADITKDLSQGSSAGGTVIIQNNNTTQAKTNIQRTAPQEQLNPTMR